MDPLPPLNKVYSLVVQEESNNFILSPSPPVQDDSSVLINASDSRKSIGHSKNSSSNKQSSRFCTFCNRKNYTVEFCYQKHGHPSFNKQSSSVNASLGEGSEVAYGGIVVVPPFGSNQEQLSQLVSLLQQSNLLSSASSPNTSTSSQPLTENPTTINTISGIYSISPSLPSLSDVWIIDSGANDHVFCSMHYFSSFYKIKPTRVSLPNGHLVMVEYAGNVTFYPTLHISHVFYSPMFKINLIFVSKLCESLSCHVDFSNSTCMIQAMKCPQMIGLGELVNGLYRLKVQATVFPAIHSVSSSSNFSISCNNVVFETYIPKSAL